MSLESSSTSVTPPAPCPMSSTLPWRIAQEHCYCKLGPFRSTVTQSVFPTTVLFPDRIGGKKDVGDGSWSEEGAGHSSLSADNTPEESPPVETKDEEKEREGEGGEEVEVDVVGMDPVPDLPFDERKVGAIMVECSRHVNLVRVPAEKSDPLLDRVLGEVGHRQRELLSRLVRILEGDHLARLACANIPHEPIKRRLNSDRAARQFRKALADINWDAKLTQWAHETLIQVLNIDLLPVYLDVLQVLKAKCPVLVEQMIHSSMGMVGGEAFGLLLKRPWNPVAGMHPLDRQVRQLAHHVRFEPSPIFISLPYSSTGVGGRRWRLWQSQLSSLGKVYPVILPDSITDPSHGVGLSELAEQMVITSLGRVHELRCQYPTRPVVLFGWSVGARIACKIAEVETIACIVSLGLPVAGVNHKWELSSDPFRSCRTPTFFAVGTEGKVTSVEHIESLRSQMNCPTSLVVVGGGDDLLRLSTEDKYVEVVCQSVVDRCIMEKMYEFMVHTLPCSYPEEPRYSRKRKSSHVDEIGSTFLTPAVPQSPIILMSASEDSDKNFNLNNSNPLLWKTILSLKQGGRSSPGSRSSSSSPVPVLDPRSFFQDGMTPPSSKRPPVGDLPKMGRPRSKSTVERPKKKWPLRSRSKSNDQSDPQKLQSMSKDSFIPIPLLAGNCNSNNNNSSDVSPPQLLAIPQTHFRPLPVTPPRNPFEDPMQKLDPKTLKQLQRK